MGIFNLRKIVGVEDFSIDWPTLLNPSHSREFRWRDDRVEEWRPTGKSWMVPNGDYWRGAALKEGILKSNGTIEMQYV